MYTHLCRVSDIPPTDSSLLRALESAAWAEPAGDAARIAVCNARGDIYRIVETRGVAEFVSVYHALITQGLTSTITPAPGSGWHLIVG